MTDEIRVLYVEDDPQSRKLMKMLLSGRMGLPNVTIFEDSQDFLERVNALQPKPTVIFLDIHVKPINGFKMLELLRAQAWTDTVAIVALTASVMNEEVQQLTTAGFDGCLAKPIDMTTFPDTLRRLVGGESIWSVMQ
jgi:CheY-like chemotaxis protein